MNLALGIGAWIAAAAALALWLGPRLADKASDR